MKGFGIEVPEVASTTRRIALALVGLLAIVLTPAVHSEAGLGATHVPQDAAAPSEPTPMPEIRSVAARITEIANAWLHPMSTCLVAEESGELLGCSVRSDDCQRARKLFRNVRTQCRTYQTATFPVTCARAMERDGVTPGRACFINDDACDSASWFRRSKCRRERVSGDQFALPEPHNRSR